MKVFKYSLLPLTFGKIIIHKLHESTVNIHKTKGNHFLFGSVFIKKIIIKLKLKKKTKTSSNRPVLVRFSFLRKKPVQTSLARFFSFGSVFSGLARFFSVSVRFGFLKF